MPGVISDNEKFANEKSAKVLRITFYVLSAIYILDLLNIFIIDIEVMTITYAIGSALLWIPTFLNMVFHSEGSFLKYVYIIDLCIFIGVLSTTLTYHIIIIYVLPMAVAVLYFSKKLNIVAVVGSVISIVAGNLMSLVINNLPDLNYNNVTELIVYSLVPKVMSMICLVAIFILITNRASYMIMSQKRAAEELKVYHHEMVMGFATMVENRDDSTGGHIRRTSQYAVLLAEELKKRDIYSDALTEQFIENLKMAAPMHDVGKIGVPDDILKKTGRLTEDEYEIMKTHSENGGRIIKETFWNTGNADFNKMAYEVARYHHEKWNSKGYPEGIGGFDIPLCARIMAVVDVFDAVSAKRVYRDAMPLDKAFSIIEDGRGEDFEPILVDVFLSLRPEIEKIMRES
ncbi:MAG: HD domain-containing protein [Eubacteriales bacterium]|nr:HD domain-containing protein [Eubacteriales bacterium]